MKKELKISIVTPTYNSEAFLEKCILSVGNQKWDNYEHIIIDGGSTDNTLNIIRKYEKKYHLKWISEPDKGMYDAINKGFAMASGDIMAWLNSDDIYFPWTFDVVARVFEKKGIDWLSGIPSNTKKMADIQITYLLPNLPTVYNTKMIRKGVYDGRRMCFVQQESCFWSRRLWEKTGGLKTEYKLAGDYFLWKSFAKYADLYTVNCNLASFRIHENQLSTDKKGYTKEIGTSNCPKLLKVFLQVYLHMYSLVKYQKYVINLEKLYEK